MGKARHLTQRESFWLEHLRRCGKGSMRAYAEANGLNVRSLYGAKKRLKRRGLLPGAGPRLVRVERAPPSGAAATACRVHLRNGTTLEFACAPEHWGELLSRVAALP